MLTKGEISKPEVYLLEIFKQIGFKRRKCGKCGKFFWSAEERGTCGDTTCDIYSFINNPPIKAQTWRQIRKKYLKWFENNAHTIVNRYPTVARWKPDTFYTGASIYCFQPWVLSREAEPPANPLVIDQPSVRFGDIDNIGLGTGRHCSEFSMLAHHAFNYPDKKIYWKEKTVELCYGWLTEGLKIRPELISFIESFWEGGGNAGPCFEVLISGNEIATLVFMEYEKSNTYRPMNMKVVDTGYGLERAVWLSQGTPTIYDSIHENIISFLKRKAGIREYDKKIFSDFCKLSAVLNVEEVNVEQMRKKIVHEISKNSGVQENEIMEMVLPYHNIYQIADHTKTIAFILGDGVVPSNVAEGYLARLLIRRCIRAVKELGIVIPLREIVERQIKEIRDVYPEIENNDILKLVDVEEEKYSNTLKRGRQIIANLEKNRKQIDEKTLIMLYESYGLLPRDVKNFASKNVKLPDMSDIDTKIAVQKGAVKKKEKPKIDVSGIPETEKLYYENENLYEFSAKVLKSEGERLILDKTAFYPRGGGAEPDLGTIGGKRVYDVEKVGNVVIHHVEGVFKIGETVAGRVDRERREAIKKHHTAVHILNLACNRVLGSHVWQAGSYKDDKKARLDITHYENLSERQIEEIENICNEIIRNNLPVRKEILRRTDAERKYGFRLYQGGAVPGKLLRIVSIAEDSEACGGLHVNNTAEVGKIKILKTEKIQDGVVRIEIVAGKAVDEYYRHLKLIAKSVAEIVGEDKILEAVKNLVKKREFYRRRLEEVRRQKVEKITEELKFESIGDKKVLIAQIENADIVREISKKLSSSDTVILLFSLNERITVFGSAGKNTNVNIGKLVSQVCKELGGKGGGSEFVGQGFGTDKDKLEEVIKKLRERLK